MAWYLPTRLDLLEVGSRDSPVSTSLLLGEKCTHQHAPLFMWVLGPELRSSCLQDKNVTDYAVSPTLTLVLAVYHQQFLSS